MSEPRQLASARNLAEWPWAMLDDRPRQELLVISDTIRHGKEELVRSLTIRPAMGLGLPTSSDELILLALIELARRVGYASSTVEFRATEILGMLDWDTSGRYRTALRDGLRRLQGVRLEARRAWYDPSRGGWVDLDFGLVDLVVSPSDNPDSRSYHVTLSVPLIESARAGYVGMLRLDVCRAVGVIARRLYAYLDRACLDGKPVFAIGMKKLAQSRLGLDGKSYPYPSDVLKRLTQAHRQLVEHGVIQAAEIRGTGWDTIVEYRIANRSGDMEQVKALMAEGISRQRAKALLKDISWDQLVPHLPALRVDKKVRDKAAWLAAAVANGYVHGQKFAAMTRRTTSSSTSTNPKVIAEKSTDEELTADDVAAALDQLSAEEYAQLEALASQQLWAEGRVPQHDAAQRYLRRRMAERHLGYRRKLTH